MRVWEILKKIRKRMRRARQPLKLTGAGQVLILIALAIGAAAMNTGNNLLYLSGIPHHKVASNEIIEKVVKLVESRAKEKVN